MEDKNWKAIKEAAETLTGFTFIEFLCDIRDDELFFADYEWYKDTVSTILTQIEEMTRDLDDIRDPGDSIHEYIDGAVCIYYNDIVEWLYKNHGAASYYIEEATSEGRMPESPDLYKMIQVGQCYAIEAIWHQVIEALEKMAEDAEDGE